MNMTHWRPDGTGLQPGGAVGGDVQATDSFSVRYTRSDRAGAVVTVYFYGIDREHRYAVETQIETVVCADPRDPGGTEQWSEVTYRVTDGQRFTTPHEAELHARALAEQHTGALIAWDGLAPWQRGRPAEGHHRQPTAGPVPASELRPAGPGSPPTVSQSPQEASAMTANAETTSLSAALSYTQQMASESQQGVSSVETSLASLTAGGVTGATLAHLGQAQEMLGQAAQEFTAAHEALVNHIAVQEAYNANADAGSKEFVTGD